MHLLFAGDDYYPKGGAEDLMGSYGTVDAAIAAHNPTLFNYRGGWAHVFDMEKVQIVRWFDRGNWFDSDPNDWDADGNSPAPINPA